MNNNTLDGLNNSTNTTLDGSGGSSGYTPDWYKALGVTLALTSGLFIGSSFIFKKKGLLDTNALGHEPAKGHAYLKSPMWWTGMILSKVDVSHLIMFPHPSSTPYLKLPSNTN